MNQGIGDLPPCSMEIPPGSFPRDPKVRRRFLLFQAIEIDEPENLHLLRLEGDDLLPLGEAALGGIAPRRVPEIDVPTYAWPAPAPDLLIAVPCRSHLPRFLIEL
jgi:hypothetical protein